MSGFKPQMLYTERQTTILHSLEALIGQIDFNKVKRHVDKSRGIFGSPASTAAYLIHSSEWDPNAEEYLRKVVRRYSSSGKVPSAYPTPIFELSWTVCLFDSCGLLVEAQQSSCISAAKTYLSTILKGQGGITGFAAGILPDADDTAKAIAALQCLGETVDLEPMVKAFETKTHFKTYDLERNSSISANCNVLAALCGSPNVQRFVSQAEKAIRFLVEIWDTGIVVDKWNLSQAYSHMSLGCALVAVLEKFDQGGLPGIDKTLIAERVPLVLCQLLSRVLSEQFKSSVWTSSCVEVSSYNVILLGKLLTLPWPTEIRKRALSAFQKGREYVAANEMLWCKPNYLWIEKVTYGSPVLSEAYSLAAVSSECVQAAWSDRLVECFLNKTTRSQEMAKLVSSIPLFQNTAVGMLHLAQLEASHFARRLLKVRLQIFLDRDATMSEDKYLFYIPLAWTSCQLLGKSTLSNKVLWEMTVLSLLNYQVDEYMESVVAKLSKNGSKILLQSLRSVCDLSDDRIDAYEGSGGNEERKDTHSRPTERANQYPPSPPNWDDYLDDKRLYGDIQRAYDALVRYIQYILQHQAVVSSPSSIRARLKREVFAFMQAHIEHNEANRNLKLRSADPFNSVQHNPHSRASTNGEFRQPEQSSYFEWVRLTGADDTSCPFSFTFFCCLLSKAGSHCLSTASQMYYSQSLCRSLATMCRQYNDYGSWLRDQQEGNLNSLHFPEFGDRMPDDGQDSCSAVKDEALGSGDKGSSTTHTTENPFQAGDHAKQCLMEVAEFERSCMDLAFDRLKTKTSEDTTDAIATFVNVTDFFGQMYVAKDLASRIK